MKINILTLSLGGVLLGTILPATVFASDTMAPQVNVFNSDLQHATSFMAFDGKKTGGGEVAVANVTGDSKPEIIVAAGRGEEPLVQVFSAQGKLISQFYAYDKTMTHGLHIAAGDLNGDGIAEIVTSTDYGAPAQVRIFDYKGNAKFTPGFYAFDQSFTGGAYVTVGDFDGDGKNEIAAGAGPGGQPVVREFDKTGKFLGPTFQPFASDDQGGVAVAAVNIYGGTSADSLAMSRASLGVGLVKVYNNDGAIVGQWQAFPGTVSGVLVGAADVNGDGKEDIMVTPRQNAGPQVDFYSATGKLKDSFFAYDQDFRGGVRFASGNFTKGETSIVTIPGKNHAAGPQQYLRDIYTSLAQQHTYVYEYGDLLKDFAVSTGIPRYPTLPGNFHVLRKVFVKEYKHHYVDRPQDDYDLKNVHWNLLFNASEGDYLHYAYWHHNFGHVMSHGCINLDAASAEWLYNWAKVGDPVTVVTK